MWESRVLCEISKRLWKSFCDFHGGGISTAVCRCEQETGRGERSSTVPAAAGGAIGSAAIGEVTQRKLATIQDNQLFAEWVKWGGGDSQRGQ